MNLKRKIYVPKEIDLMNKINHFNLIRIDGICVDQETATFFCGEKRIESPRDLL